MAPRIDYDFHQQRYFERLADEPGLTVRQYCDDEGLKFNSARRYIKSSPGKNPTVKKVEKLRQVKASKRSPSRDWPMIYERYLNQLTIEPTMTMADFAQTEGLPYPQLRRCFNELRKKGDHANLEDLARRALDEHTEEVEESDRKIKALKNKKKSIRVSKGRLAPTEHELAQITTDHSSDAQDLSCDDEHRDHLGRFTKGNRFSMVHGGYARLTSMDPDVLRIVSNVNPLNLATELATVRAQYLSMLNYLTTEKAAIVEMYANGECFFEFDGETKKSLNKALAEIESSLSGKLRTLENSIANLTAVTAKIEIDYLKLEQKAYELPPVDAATGLMLRKKIFKERESKNLSALETARRFEYYGLKVPDTILEEAKREIATYEPPTDDDGISDDELDRLVEEHQEKKRKKLAELPEKREAILKIVEEFEEQESGTEIEEPPADNPLDDESEVFAFDDLSDFINLEGDDV